jgi:dTDP-4-dehydrorhamnose reductase
MKILLLGHKGYLGSYLNKNLEVDFLKERKIYNNGKEYDYVINCIGKPNLEYCESNPEETNYSNYEIIKDITLFYPNSKIINFSSYYVYDDFGYCTEESNTTKKYKYCEQKLNGENLIKNGVSFRIGKLFGHNDLLKQNKLTEYIIKNDELTLDNVSFNPTSLSQVLKILEFEIKNNTLFGVYNLSNYGNETHYNYGCYINNLLGGSKKITQLDKINRNFSNYGKFLMSTEKLNKIYKLTPWQTDVKNYIQSL